MSPEITATYRVQLHRGFGFGDVAAVAPYLSDLGISHVYCSPYMQSRTGSSHGYDVVDPTMVNQELGGSDGLSRMIEALRAAGMGHILDIVPNHLAVDRDNAWWWDVLRNGRDSEFAGFFDIDWERPGELAGKVLLPVLGASLDDAVSRGELALEAEDEPVVRYYEHSWPLAPGSVSALERAYGSVHAGVYAANADRAVLSEVLGRQHYRLELWREGGAKLNYRRFFDISTLIGVRVEDEAVFEATHAKILDLVHSGDLEGLRVDHIDGLRDPGGYLARLRRAAPDAFLVVEKILEPDERLPASWPVDGTTGYEFLNRLTWLFVDRRGATAMTQTYEDFTGDTIPFAEIVHDAKVQVMDELLAADVDLVAEKLTAALAGSGEGWGVSEVRAALVEVVAALPVYRTYVSPAGDIDADDAGRLREAVKSARRRRRDIGGALFGALDRALTHGADGSALDAVLRLQQMTGPVMAKGFEDTALYRYHRLIALNDVGGDPTRFGSTVDEFHEWAARRQKEWPASLLASSTHDTKRSEDVRARLDLLAEVPGDWRDAVTRWARRNETYRVDGSPDRHTEYLLYQTLVGAWPIEQARVSDYMSKAIKEAKMHTSWIDPDEAYESSVAKFVAGVMSDRRFLDDVAWFVDRIEEPAWVTSIAQTLVKLTAPGIPDIYQGTELWDRSLVDPDNRRPVDYATRRGLLGDLRAATPEQIWARRAEGAPKLHVIAKALEVRAARGASFGPSGRYTPIPATGRRRTHVVAFRRGRDVVTVVPRLVVRLSGRWEDTAIELPRGRWSNAFTGEAVGGGTVEVAELLARWPVALLVRGRQ